MLKHFNYWLTGHGWAEVFFTSDLQSIRFEFSYLSDPLTELIDSLLELLTSSQNEACVDFFDEPGHHRLTFTMIGNGNVLLQIRMWIETEGLTDIAEHWRTTKPVFEVADTLKNVCSVVYAGIVDLRSRSTEVEYYEQWVNYPFPSDQFKFLGQAVSKTI